MAHVLNPLPYAKNALEPVIDERTMVIHHDKHHQTYVDNLNNALLGTDEINYPLEKLFENISKYPVSVRNNAGGHYNHTLFWNILSPSSKSPSNELINAIDQQFGSIDILKKELNDAGLKRFGSGWVWLIVTNGILKITSTANQDNPLMDVVEEKGTPLLGIDVWEHAYYLKHQNKRADYLNEIWQIINWEEVSKRYVQAI